MARRVCMSVVLLSLLVFAPAFLRAQNGAIIGTVQDPSGAAVPGADLSLRVVGIDVVTKTTSGPDGLYSFRNLQVGTYELSASTKGFRDFVQKGLTVSVGQTTRLDLKLELGMATQTIEVSANASPLKYDSGAQSGTLSPQSIAQLPLILGGHTRTAVQFIRLLPGVTSGGDEDKLGFNTRINGGSNEGDEALLDGISILDGALGQNGFELAVTGHPMSPEAITEITLLTANYDAQYGATSSSVLTAVTKAGTDKFHGSVYELLHNSWLNARPYFAANRPVDTENDFGGSIGGPFKIPVLFWGAQKKTYFFFNYEAFRIRGAVSAPYFTLPTAAMRTGDFSGYRTNNGAGTIIPIYDPATSVRNPQTGEITRQQFMGCNGLQPNVICATDPRLVAGLTMADQWLKYVPMPNLPGLISNYTPPIPPPTSVNSDSTVIDIRMDQYIREKDHVAVIVHYFGSFGMPATVYPIQITNDGMRKPNINWANRLNWDHTIRPNLLNNFNLGYNNILSGFYAFDEKQAGVVPQIPGVLNHAMPPVINIGGYPGFGNNTIGETTRPAWIANDHLIWSRGKHTIGIGAEWRALQDKEANEGNASGTFGFSALTTGILGQTSGNGLASFLLGTVDNMNMNVFTVGTMYGRQKMLAIYANDSWKVTPKLTLTGGLRWDVSTPIKEKWDHMSYMSPFVPNPGAGNRLGALVFAGHDAGAASLGRSYPESTYYKQIGPRVGFAYAITPNTVVRGGYGIFYQILAYYGWGAALANGKDGFNTAVSFNSTDGGMTPVGLLKDGFVGRTWTQPPQKTLTFDNGRYASLYRQFEPAKSPMAQQFNLTVEHRFTQDFYISAAYVGNIVKHITSLMAPINVLNPSRLSMGSQLVDQFQVGGPTTLHGVTIPYTGWVEQLTNIGSCAPTVAQALQPYPQYCGNLWNYGENAGYSNYNGFQFKAEKRMSRGFWLLGSYTWSKFNSTFADIQTISGWFSPYQRTRTYGLDNQDTPHAMSLSIMWDLPFGKGQRFLNRSGMGGKLLDKAVGGWKALSIFRASSGIPLSFSAGCDVPGQFAATCVPGVIPGKSVFAQTMDNYNPNLPLFNKSAFEFGATGGQMGYNLGQGQRITGYRNVGYHNHDLAFIKTFGITESVKLEMRAEFYNVWNWHMFTQGSTWWQGGAFDTNIASGTFGVSTRAVTMPRNIQFGAKILF